MLFYYLFQFLGVLVNVLDFIMPLYHFSQSQRNKRWKRPARSAAPCLQWYSIVPFNKFSCVLSFLNTGHIFGVFFYSDKGCTGVYFSFKNNAYICKEKKEEYF